MELPLDGELSTENYADIEDMSGNEDSNNNSRDKSSSSSSSVSMLPAGTMSKSPQRINDHDETAKSIAELFERLNSTIEPESNNYVLKH